MYYQFKYKFGNVIRSPVAAVFAKDVSCAPPKFKFSGMVVKEEQKVPIKFCCRSKKSEAETLKLMHDTYADAEWLGSFQTVTAPFLPCKRLPDRVTSLSSKNALCERMIVSVQIFLRDNKV